MRYRLALLAAAFLFLVASPGLPQGQGHGVSILASDPKLVEVRPQEVITQPFVVTNGTKAKREFVAEVQLPKGWRAVTRELPYQLEAGEQDVRLVSFYVPLSALAGRYSLLYRAKDPRNAQIKAEEKVDIVVLPVVRVVLTAEEIPQRVIAGKTYRATFKVLSRSNVKAAVVLSLKSSNDFRATASPDHVDLPPGGSREIQVDVRTDEKLNRVLRHRLVLRAKVDQVADEDAPSASIQVEVIPRVTGEVDRYRRIPAQVKTSWGHENGGSNAQVELSGYGFLDKDETREVDFLFRQPSGSDDLLFGFQDEYRISYATPDLDLHLGDRGYGLSALTEQYRYGRGFEARTELKSLEVGGYYMETHREQPGQRQLALALSERVRDDLDLGMNYLKKKSPPRMRTS